MPTLGFLKKKKTREHDPHDPHSPIDHHLAPTSAGGTRDSPSPSSTNIENPTNTLDRPTDTMMANHGLPTPTSAPRSGNQDTPASRPHTGDSAYKLQHDGPTASRPDTHISNTNGTGDINPIVPSNHQPAVPRTTKGKYQLQDFTLKRTLGTGSFGRVHLVQSNHNERFYAIKVLKKAQVVKMKQVEHTNDERKMLQKVKHAFLVTLWGTFQDSRNLYMVMDFVEGGELFSLLRKSQVSRLHSYHCCGPYLFFGLFAKMLTHYEAIPKPCG